MLEASGGKSNYTCLKWQPAPDLVSAGCRNAVSNTYLGLVFSENLDRGGVSSSQTFEQQ